MFSRLFPLAFIVFVSNVAPASAAEKDKTAPTPVRRAHAHNDYLHERPLLDALAQGFCSVEADVLLVDGELLVAHERKSIRPERTLEKLYLAPLKERIRANDGHIYPNGPPFYLLIDIKTEARSTYTAVDKVLARYGDILSAKRGDSFERKAVTVVVSGNRDLETMAAQQVRYAGIDGRPSDLDSGAPAHQMPWISANWSLLFRWRGEGAMPDEQRRRLREFVGKAHKHGRMVRFWGTPDKPALWRELLAAEVDLINTDKLSELRRFLVANAPAR